MINNKFKRMIFICHSLFFFVEILQKHYRNITEILQKYYIFVNKTKNIEKSLKKCLNKIDRMYSYALKKESKND